MKLSIVHFLSNAIHSPFSPGGNQPICYLNKKIMHSNHVYSLNFGQKPLFFSHLKIMLEKMLYYISFHHNMCNDKLNEILKIYLYHYRYFDNSFGDNKYYHIVSKEAKCVCIFT